MSAPDPPAPPGGTAELFAQIRGATSDLRRAAVAGDPHAIREAVDRRQTLVDRLESRIAEIRKTRGDEAAEMLSGETRRLAEQARGAEADLRALLERARREQGLRSEQSSALRAYAAAPLEAKGLDRAG